MSATEDRPVWRPRKSLGQHFLTDARVARRIVEFAEVRPEETILEIGPGFGALTGMLCERAARVVAVEIDPHVAEELTRRVPSERLIVVTRDILQVDLAEFAEQMGVPRWPIVANLPYVISSRLLMQLVRYARAIDRATVTVQREVGERILAAPGSRTYGLLSVLLQATGQVRKGFLVGPGAFRPVPQVHSLVLAWRSRPPESLDLPALIATTKAAFAQRRKRIDNALRTLRGVSGALIADACRAAEVDAGARAEHLTPEAFIRLSHALAQRGAFPAHQP